MRKIFIQQLKELNFEIITMASYCEESLSYVIDFFNNKNIEKLENCRELEKLINLQERKVEDLSLKILLEQQPVASDLRNVSASLRIVSDLERIGDQIDDIAKILLKNKEYFLKNMMLNEEIKNMALEINNMIKNTIDSYVKKDIELAKSVIMSDDVIDEYFIKNKNYIVELIRKDRVGEYVDNYLNLFMITKYFEKIGDHCNNIADWVIYVVEGNLP